MACMDVIQDFPYGSRPVFPTGSQAPDPWPKIGATTRRGHPFFHVLRAQKGRHGESSCFSTGGSPHLIFKPKVLSSMSTSLYFPTCLSKVGWISLWLVFGFSVACVWLVPGHQSGARPNRSPFVGPRPVRSPFKFTIQVRDLIGHTLNIRSI